MLLSITAFTNGLYVPYQFSVMMISSSARPIIRQISFSLSCMKHSAGCFVQQEKHPWQAAISPFAQSAPLYHQRKAGFAFPGIPGVLSTISARKAAYFHYAAKMKIYNYKSANFRNVCPMKQKSRNVLSLKQLCSLKIYLVTFLIISSPLL